MKILLIGEFSNVHWTLAEVFRAQGHKVKVVSTGDGWKNYNRDVDINFESSYQLFMFIAKSYYSKLFEGYDIVQLINYQFLFSGRFLPYTKNIFEYLKKKNGRVILGAFGDDYFYVKACLQGYFRYSAFNSMSSEKKTYADQVIKSNYTSTHRDVNKYLADRADLIIACMYEYYEPYRREYLEKLKFIPLPVSLENLDFTPNKKNGKIKLFLGIQANRSSWKGADKILSSLQNFLNRKDNNKTFDLTVAQNLPYNEYIKKYNECNILFDQLYAYSLGMNALTAMAKGKIVFGGGEPEAYNLLKETDHFPVINISPDNICNIEQLIYKTTAPEHKIEELGIESRKFIEKHHCSKIVGQSYINQYLNIL